MKRVLTTVGLCVLLSTAIVACDSSGGDAAADAGDVLGGGGGRDQAGGGGGDQTGEEGACIESSTIIGSCVIITGCQEYAEDGSTSGLADRLRDNCASPLNGEWSDSGCGTAGYGAVCEDSGSTPGLVFRTFTNTEDVDLVGMDALRDLCVGACKSFSEVGGGVTCDGEDATELVGTCSYRSTSCTEYFVAPGETLPANVSESCAGSMGTWEDGASCPRTAVVCTGTRYAYKEVTYWERASNTETYRGMCTGDCLSFVP